MLKIYFPAKKKAAAKESGEAGQEGRKKEKVTIRNKAAVYTKA